MMRPGSISRGQNAHRRFEKIIIARTHEIYKQFPGALILFWEFHRVLDEFFDWCPPSTRRLYEGSIPTSRFRAFVLAVRNNARFDLILYDRQQGLCPTCELSGNYELE